jgi:tetratricopeptide (TPR) repeat protein
MFFTEFSTVRIQESFVLYRSYLWAVGAFFAFPIIFGKVNSQSAASILIVTAIVYFPISMERLATMSHPILLWDDAEKLVVDHKELPGVSRIYYNRGTEYLKVDFYDKAIADLKQAVVLSPKFVEAYGNLGVTYLKKQDWPNAISTFSRAIELTIEKGTQNPAKYYQGRGDAFAGASDLNSAQMDYRESCRLGARSCDKVH